MKKKTEYKHTETPSLKFTAISEGNDPEGERSRDKYLKEVEYAKKVGLYFQDEETKGEFILSGFTTVTDPAGDSIIHYKIKDNGVFMFLKTAHPDAEKLYISMVRFANIMGFQIQDALDFIKDMKSSVQKEIKGELKTHPGIHPDMEYLKTKGISEIKR